MKNIKYVLLLALLVGFIFWSCIKDHKIDKSKYGNCMDAIQNQNEEKVDCGGVCAPCTSCNDGVKNQGETGIDCGGQCQSCSPSCSITAGTCDYTLFPAGYTFSVSGVATGGGYYSNNSYNITVNLTDPIMVNMQIQFKDNFNPITFIPLNETMIFTTIDNGATINANSNVQVTYSGNINFGSITGEIDPNQSIFITKISNTSVLIRFCNISAGNERFSLNATSS